MEWGLENLFACLSLIIPIVWEAATNLNSGIPGGGGGRAVGPEFLNLHQTAINTVVTAAVPA